jgi:hypothetical protein
MYPFRPKSTSSLKAGQYWSFRLNDGRFVVGVVLSRCRKRNGKIDSRLFLAGLLDWVGASAPSPHELENRRLKERGFAHVKTITENGGDLLGEVYSGWEYPEEIDTTDSTTTWGFGMIHRYAEKHFGSTAG